MKIEGDARACGRLGSVLEQAAAGVAQARKQHDRARVTSNCWSGPAEVEWQALTLTQSAQIDQLGGTIYAASTVLRRFTVDLEHAQFLTGQARNIASHAGLELTAAGTIAPLDENPTTADGATRLMRQIGARNESLGVARAARDAESGAHTRLRQSLDSILSTCHREVSDAVIKRSLPLSRAEELLPQVVAVGANGVGLLAKGDQAARPLPLTGPAAKAIGFGADALPVLEKVPALSIIGTGGAVATDMQNGEGAVFAVSKETTATGAGLGTGALIASMFTPAAPAVLVGVVATGVGFGVSWVVTAIWDAGRNRPTRWTPVPPVRYLPPPPVPGPRSGPERPVSVLQVPDAGRTPNMTWPAAPRPPEPERVPVRTLRGQPVKVSEV